MQADVVGKYVETAIETLAQPWPGTGMDRSIDG